MVRKQASFEARGAKKQKTKQERTLTVALRLLLDAGEDHLGAGDVLLGVQEVLEESSLVPGDACSRV